MGLDISYYASVSYFGPIPEDGEYDYNQHTTLYVNPHFMSQADGLVTGLYVTSGDSDGFRAGSYSGYNSWRATLAAMAGYGSDDSAWEQAKKGRTEGPFWELINFSDCEGVIGQKTSAKLARDFASFQVAADAHADDWFRAKYADWRLAFETAAQGGAVEFG